MSDKEIVLQTVAAMPDGATWDDISEQVELFFALKQAQAEADRGEFISLDEFERRVNGVLAAR